MASISFITDSDPRQDYIRMMNFFLKPCGYFMEYKYKEVKLKDVNDNLVSELTFDELASESKAKIVKVSDTKEIAFGGFYNISIKDKEKGLTNILFTVDIDYPSAKEVRNYTSNVYTSHFALHRCSILDVWIYMSNVDDSVDYFATSGDYIIIKYDMHKNMITFEKGDDVCYTPSFSISMSRSDSTLNTIEFKNDDSILTRDEKTLIISSKGDDNHHKIARRYALPEEYFEVTYREEPRMHFTGRIEVDKTNDIDFKHYSNSKLINNKNVREFIDEVVNKYKERFPYTELPNDLLCGYLFNEYLNGKPNNNKVANNCLEMIKFPIHVKDCQRSRNKGKKNHK